MNEQLNLTPQEYFDQVKEKKQHVTDEMLNQVYDNCLRFLINIRLQVKKLVLKNYFFI